MSGYYTIEAAAKISRISINAVRYWIRKGLLTPLRGGGNVYFDEEEVKLMKKIKTLNCGGCTVGQIMTMLGRDKKGY